MIFSWNPNEGYPPKLCKIFMNSFFHNSDIHMNIAENWCKWKKPDLQYLIYVLQSTHCINENILYWNPCKNIFKQWWIIAITNLFAYDIFCINRINNSVIHHFIIVLKYILVIFQQVIFQHKTFSSVNCTLMIDIH